MTESDILSISINRDESWGKILATATIKFSNGLTAKGLKVVNGAKGVFLGMPSRKVDEEWQNLLELEERDDYGLLSRMVLKAYDDDDKALTESFSDDENY